MKQYETLTECVSLVRKSWLSRHEQLQLEILLIQAKMLLLNDAIRAELEGDVRTEALFERLYLLLADICDGKIKPAGFQRVVQFLTEMVIELKSRSEDGLPAQRVVVKDSAPAVPQMTRTEKK